MSPIPISDRMARVAPRVVFAVVLVVVIIYLVTTPGYANIATLRSVLLGSAFVGLLAVGQSVVMISGNFVSMSVGTQVAVAALLFLGTLRYGIITAMLVALTVSIALSAVQGYAVGALGANPIVLTIGASVLLEGIAIVVTKGATVRNDTGVPLSWLSAPVLGIAPPVIAFVVLTILIQLYLRRIRLGVSAYLLGTNARAARAAGLSAGAISVGAFIVGGIACGTTGIVLGASQGSGSMTLQGSLTFDSIAAVLVGGVAVSGGRGSAVGAAIGAVIISAVNSALLIRGVPIGAQILIKGVVVLAAVLLVRSLTRGTTR